jgi:flagellar biosynthesis/type III secretory pathway M-ring protein FliF/YscJ
LQALCDKEKPNLTDAVVKAIGLPSSEAVSMTMYDDSNVPALVGAGSDTSGGGSTMAAMLDGHAKEFAVGALAVVSLFMVSMIVKKGTPAPIPAPIVEVKQTPRLGADELIAGIVGEEGGTPLDGMELGEDAIKAQHMVEQVSTLVKENPDAAASLVKRWLNRS